MATYLTSEGDVLDAVCHEHYNGMPGAFERVLAANPGLAALGVVLPAGVSIELPLFQSEPAIAPLDLFG